MVDFSEAQKKYLKSLLSDFNAIMNEKIELLETNIKTELEKNKVEFEERLKIYEDKIIKLESRNEQLRKELNIVAEKQEKNKIIINGLDIGERSPSYAAIQILSSNQIKVDV
ncbi:hypothetical protein HHI36_003491 [Cryptolaemus montrouzieri]|uniref:Uncharacterized protein n=1 Tax=Cryptolaemus montrouzieri TaxID=559131 RepID=A0ABD2PDJ7_9CUCU